MISQQILHYCFLILKSDSHAFISFLVAAY